MFNGEPDGEAKADAVASYLGQHSNFKSHGRCIKLKQLQEKNFGLKVASIRSSVDLQKKIWDVYCAVDVIFSATGIFKIFYNSKEEALIRAQQVVAFERPVQVLPAQQ